ncbi:MAG: nickel pincer cofactor biosynthesis protein LarB [Chloroflexi bacterium]|nr:nickel pincer cofactor biosynthesis protein LarB [Chloroflexota bacterium]
MTPDFDRDVRTGVPEVILGEGKSIAMVVDVARRFLDRRGRAIISRTKLRLTRALQEEFRDDVVETYRQARMVVVRRQDFPVATGDGKVGIVTAGTSDVGVAEEAQVIAQEMGCVTRLAADVGVAGLHRLVSPLQDMLGWGADAIIVAAGMDGALPSVVAGLVDVPVIGLPTSRGYGVGGAGVAALLSMLQSCVPGLVVVNVDNGIGAGASAARIANHIAAARAERLVQHGVR